MLRVDCKSAMERGMGKGPMHTSDRTIEGGRHNADRGWTKAISIERDHLQSRGLVAIASVALLALCLRTAQIGIPGIPGNALLSAFAISCLFAAGAWKLHAATPAGAACGGLICLLLTFWTQSPASSTLSSALTPLILLFLLTFAATRAGRHKKALHGLAEARRGRNAAQIIANLGTAAICAGLPALIVHISPAILLALHTACLAALVEATADTVSSEIGQAFGGPPRMFLTLRQVTVGTDGAVTALGTLAGVLAAALVAAAGMAAMSLDLASSSIALLAGVSGLFFDSLLGATVERRGWLGNDLVNLSSTIFSAVFAFAGSAALR